MATPDKGNRSGDLDRIQAEASEWMVKQERGLSDRETEAFREWLFADERHGRAFQRAGQAWDLLGGLPADRARAFLPDAPKRVVPFWRRPLVIGAAAAAALAIVVASVWRPGLESDTAGAVANATVAEDEGPRTKLLEDGTLVRLNTGSAIETHFTARERRVTLLKGEAHFEVMKDPFRPFKVEADQVAVEAVGTAFNVSLREEEIDVIVTEGVVRVTAGPTAAERLDSSNAGSVESREAAPESPTLTAGHRASVRFEKTRAMPEVTIAKMDDESMNRALSWRDPLLRLKGESLSELVESFERRTGRRLIIADPALADLRLGGAFSSSDVEGFARALRGAYDIEARVREDGALVVGETNGTE